MTQEEIRAEYRQRSANIGFLRATYEGAVGIERAHIERVRRFCSHPNGHETSCMGERGYACPDCGYSR